MAVFLAQRLPAPKRRGLTLVEILVSLAVTAVLVSAVTATFISILRTSNDSEVAINASANARAALTTMVREIKAANSPLTLMDNPDHPLPTGDGQDDDRDELIDEERPNGLNDDSGLWVDRHVLIGGRYERPDGVGIPDLGDEGVDEDTIFNLDRLSFTITPPGGPAYQVAYRVRSFDGQDRVLVRTVNGVDSAPLAFDVVSFNVLCWSPTTRLWENIWSGAELPATVFVEIGIDADPRSPATRQSGESFRTVSLRTVIALERVIP